MTCLAHIVLTYQPGKIPEHLLSVLFAINFLVASFFPKDIILPYLWYTGWLFVFLESLQISLKFCSQRRKRLSTAKGKPLAKLETDPFEGLDEKDVKAMEMKIRKQLDEMIANDGKLGDGQEEGNAESKGQDEEKKGKLPEVLSSTSDDAAASTDSPPSYTAAIASQPASGVLSRLHR